jgi:hypothetical protein
MLDIALIGAILSIAAIATEPQIEPARTTANTEKTQPTPKCSSGDGWCDKSTFVLPS